MEKRSTPSSIAISKAIMPTVKYSFLAIEMSLNHRETDLFIFQVLIATGRAPKYAIGATKQKVRIPFGYPDPIPHPEPIMFLVSQDFPALNRDQIDPGYDRGISEDIQQARQIIIEIPEIIQTGQAGGSNGDQHQDRD